jgi:GTP-binding protein HflX
VRLQREENRRSRKKSQLPVVSLVGYTNAGKSSLFNKLTNNQSVAEDKLFATLDPLMRKITLPNNGGVILADTVGFIQDLPHQLVEAFKGTLEETKGADLLLHVVDLSSENYRQHIEVVNQVLAEIGAQKIPIILIYNKIDLLSGVKADYQIAGQQHSVWLSAETGEGIAELLAGIFQLFYGEVKQYELILQPHHGKARALLYQKDAVVSEHHTDDGRLVLKVKLSTKDHQEVQALLS